MRCPDTKCQGYGFAIKEPMNEPKPQTPLTDAFEESLETGNFIKRVKKAMDFVRSLELELQEAERQRDEAKDYAKRQEDFLQRVYACTCVHHNDKERSELVCPVCLKAERDQLIKVVDAYALALTDEQLNKADKAYSLLPHVQAKKGNKE